MFGSLEPSGVGLIRFAMDGQLPLFARGVYGAASAISLVFPSLVLWFAWRSLQNSFSFTAVFAMSGDEGLVAGDSLRPDAPITPPSAP